MGKTSTHFILGFTGGLMFVGFQNCSGGFMPLSTLASLSSTLAPSSIDAPVSYITTTTEILPGAAATGSVAFGTLCETNGSCSYGWLPEGQTRTISCQSGFININGVGYGGGSAYTSCQNYVASACTGMQTCSITFNGTNCESEPNSDGSNAGYISLTCADKVQPSVIRYADFLNSIGVQTHLAANVQGNAYTNYQNIANDLDYLGIKFVRDGLYPRNSTDAELLKAYELLVSKGVTFVSGAGSDNPDLTSVLQDLDAMLVRFPNSVYAMEGPNEIANFQFNYKGQSGQAAADAFQKEYYAAVHADVNAKGIPVLNYTTGNSYSTGASPSNQKNGAGISDFSNTHPYANNGFGGYQPGWYMPYTNLQEYGSAKMNPSIITEAGFNTATAANGVTLPVQAVLTVNTLFDASIFGVTRVYVYELLDMYNDASNANGENHWGLFDGNNQPKPAAVAIHNLMNVLSDSGASAKTFPLAPIAYSISNLPSRARSLLLQSSTGQYAIAIWNESDRLNTGSTATPINNSITLNVSGSFGAVSVYSPIDGTMSSASLANHQLPLMLSTKPILVFLN